MTFEDVPFEFNKQRRHEVAGKTWYKPEHPSDPGWDDPESDPSWTPDGYSVRYNSEENIYGSPTDDLEEFLREDILKWDTEQHIELLTLLGRNVEQEDRKELEENIATVDQKIQAASAVLLSRKLEELHFHHQTFMVNLLEKFNHDLAKTLAQTNQSITLNEHAQSFLQSLLIECSKLQPSISYFPCFLISVAVTAVGLFLGLNL